MESNVVKRIKHASDKRFKTNSLNVRKVVDFLTENDYHYHIKMIPSLQNECREDGL